MADHPNKLAFEEGATYILQNWTALKLAVEQDWGGVESADKRDWLIDVVVDHFGKHGKKLDIDEIEDILTQVMTDEFNTTLEDDSPYLVSKHLVLLFNQCINGNFSEVERLREKAKSQNAFVASTCVKQGDDDDDDEDCNESGDDEQNSRDTDNDNDDDATMEDVPEEPKVDADGWEIVRRK